MLDNTQRGALSADQSETRHTRSCQVSCASRSAWHCIYTKPQSEYAADGALRRAKFEVYLPLHLVTWADRTKRIVPLFPRYTFARFDSLVDHWTVILRDHTGSEVGVVMRSPTTGLPLTIPDAAIDRLLAQCAPNRVIYPDERPKLAKGEKARVLNGAFAELVGVCDMAAKDRVALLLDVFGRQTRVELAVSTVERV